MNHRRTGREDGSLIVELAVMAPGPLCTRLDDRGVRQGVSGTTGGDRGLAGRGADRSDSPQSRAVRSKELKNSAVVGLFDETHLCADPQVSTDVSQFYPGGYVTVSVACQVPLSDLSVPGIPGSTTIRLRQPPRSIHIVRSAERSREIQFRASHEGSISAFVVLMLIAVFVLMGLVVDGGAELSAHQAALMRQNRQLEPEPEHCP